MDWLKLIDLAGTLNVPGLPERGLKLAADTAQWMAMIKTAAVKAGVVMAEGDQAMLDAVHADALAANDALDAKLAAAEKR